MKELIAYTWITPGATTNIICILIYWNGFKFKAVINTMVSTTEQNDIKTTLDWGGELSVLHAIPIVKTGSIVNQKLWRELHELYKLDFTTHKLEVDEDPETGQRTSTIVPE